MLDLLLLPLALLLRLVARFARWIGWWGLAGALLWWLGEQ